MKSTGVIIAVIIMAISGNMFAADSQPARTNHYVNIATTVGRALQFLKDKQEPDGYWGSGQQSYSATALALSAFLRTGETESSASYGEAISRAHKWLLTAHPEVLDDRLAVAVALSDYNIFHSDTSTSQRVTAIVKGLEEPKGSTWADIFCSTRIPDENSRPSWCLSPKQTHQKYNGKIVDKAPDTKEDYLSLYMISHAKCCLGVEAASAHYHYLADKIINRQLVDGSFPVSVQEDKAAATALVVLSLSDRYQFAPRFAPQTVATPHEEKPLDVDVNIKIR